MTNKVENQGITPPHKQNVGVTPDKVDPTNEPETFKHMITVLMIMFGDARDAENDQPESGDKIIKEAFEYAESWLVEHSEQVELEARIDELKNLDFDINQTLNTTNRDFSYTLYDRHIKDRLTNLQQSNKEKS